MADYDRMTYQELLRAYIDRFHENYPLFRSSGDTEENIREALKSGRPYELNENADKDRLY
jgi:hypothetical protein